MGYDGFKKHLCPTLDASKQRSLERSFGVRGATFFQNQHPAKHMSFSFCPPPKKKHTHKMGHKLQAPLPPQKTMLKWNRTFLDQRVARQEKTNLKSPFGGDQANEWGVRSVLGVKLLGGKPQLAWNSFCHFKKSNILLVSLTHHMNGSSEGLPNDRQRARPGEGPQHLQVRHREKELNLTTSRSGSLRRSKHFGPI